MTISSDLTLWLCESGLDASPANVSKLDGVRTRRIICQHEFTSLAGREGLCKVRRMAAKPAFCRAANMHQPKPGLPLVSTPFGGGFGRGLSTPECGRLCWALARLEEPMG